MGSVKGMVEALLFSVGRSLSVEALASILDTDPKFVRKALKDLKKDYESRDTAIRIFNDGNSWRMILKEPFVDVARKVVADTELSRAVLETLSVIAYNHPNALQSDIISARGSSAYEHIKELEDAGFISRRREGRSFRISLSEKFFEYFDVADGRDIRKVFSGINSVSEKQKKLGDLEVVDLNSDPSSSDSSSANKVLGDLEVVDEPEDVTSHDSGSSGDADDVIDRISSRLDSASDHSGEVVDDDFLSKIDDEIDRISSRNDELDNDPVLKRSPDDGLSGSHGGSDDLSSDVDSSADSLDDSLDLDDI